MDERKTKAQLKTELKQVYRALDFASKHLNDQRSPKAAQRSYFDVYQSLGLAWEFLGLQCRHWDGFKRRRDGKELCRICGKVKDVPERLYLIPIGAPKKIGVRLTPNSKQIFANKKRAQLVRDEIVFHGAALTIDVHNAYKSTLFGKGHEINVAATRMVTLKEDGIKCSVDQHVIDLKMAQWPRAKGHKPPYGGFPWELSKEKLKRFPVIFHFDGNYKFLGLTIIRPVKKSSGLTSPLTS